MAGVIERARRNGLEGLAWKARKRLGLDFPLVAAWGHLGPLSDLIGRHIELDGPPVFVIALPRSGTTWAGDVMAQAPNALYYLEPLLHAWKRTGNKGFYYRPEAGGEVPARFRRFADRAFHGVPAFHADTLLHASQFRLPVRGPRKVIVKEVNPLSAEFVLRTYKPRAILLLRHPVAVTLSHLRLKWMPEKFAGDWEKMGERAGWLLREAHNALDGYPDRINVCYEDLCAAPVPAFRKLFAFAGLGWNGDVERAIQKRSEGGDRSRPHTTSRDSALMREAWREEVTAEQLASFRRGYASLGLPYYTDNNEW